jgi:DNA/RNA endonuclease YhcR with UshA esterase domain
MRFILLIIAFTIFTNTLFSQTKIPVDSVSSHIGEKAIVCSEVFGVKATEKMTFINMGASYPNSPLTIVIFAKNLPNFKETPASLYDNKKICVTGTLEDYKGKTEIVVTQPDEITLQ